MVAAACARLAESNDQDEVISHRQRHQPAGAVARDSEKDVRGAMNAKEWVLKLKLKLKLKRLLSRDRLLQIVCFSLVDRLVVRMLIRLVVRLGAAEAAARDANAAPPSDASRCSQIATSIAGSKTASKFMNPLCSDRVLRSRSLILHCNTVSRNKGRVQYMYCTSTVPPIFAPVDR